MDTGEKLESLRLLAAQGPGELAWARMVDMSQREQTPAVLRFIASTANLWGKPYSERLQHQEGAPAQEAPLPLSLQQFAIAQTRLALEQCTTAVEVMERLEPINLGSMERLAQEGLVPFDRDQIRYNKDDLIRDDEHCRYSGEVWGLQMDSTSHRSDSLRVGDPWSDIDNYLFYTKLADLTAFEQQSLQSTSLPWPEGDGRWVWA